MSNKTPVFEDSLNKLETASRELKSQDVSLEEAIESYRSGLKAYKECREILDQATQEIETLTREAEGKGAE